MHLMFNLGWCLDWIWNQLRYELLGRSVRTFPGRINGRKSSQPLPRGSMGVMRSEEKAEQLASLCFLLGCVFLLLQLLLLAFSDTTIQLLWTSRSEDQQPSKISQVLPGTAGTFSLNWLSNYQVQGFPVYTWPLLGYSVLCCEPM